MVIENMNKRERRRKTKAVRARIHGKVTRNRPPEEWLRKTAKNLRINAESLCVKMSPESSRIAAEHIWKDGMKAKCRIKVIKKYSR